MVLDHNTIITFILSQLALISKRLPILHFTAFLDKPQFLPCLTYGGTTLKLRGKRRHPRHGCHLARYLFCHILKLNLKVISLGLSMPISHRICKICIQLFCSLLDPFSCLRGQTSEGMCPLISIVNTNESRTCVTFAAPAQHASMQSFVKRGLQIHPCPFYGWHSQLL